MSLRPLPMLAHKLPLDFSPMSPDLYVAEEKFDGHRMIVSKTVLHDSKTSSGVEAWSRDGKPCTQKIHQKMLDDLMKLPDGIYDGEIIFPGGHSYDVTRIENRDKLVLVLFDVLFLDLNVGGTLQDLTTSKQKERRAALEMIFEKRGPFAWVQLASSWPVESAAQLRSIVEVVWERHGEGVIVKDVNAHYRPGKRTKFFLKLKQAIPATLTVAGFAPSEGEINNRGAAGITVLKDDEGNYTLCKTLDDATAEVLSKRFTNDPAGEWERIKIAGRWRAFRTDHKDVGRKLCVEYHERTPDDSYRHCHWDRWEDQ